MSSQAEQLRQTMSFFRLAGIPDVRSTPEPRRNTSANMQARKQTRVAARRPAPAMELALAEGDSLDESQFARY